MLELSNIQKIFVEFDTSPVCVNVGYMYLTRIHHLRCVIVDQKQKNKKMRVQAS